jgi:Asp-tRNA(Asn)/Glu-tRNA(Gln) amidotransferase A subunit family amidase
VLRTAGWAGADAAAKSTFTRQVERLQSHGIELADADCDSNLAAFERTMEKALPDSLRINTWEMRWPLNTYRNHHAAKISPLLLNRLREAETMTITNYRALLVDRDKAGEQWRDLAGSFDGAVTLAAPAVAPIGLESSGNPVFAVASSYLRSPAVSLPLLTVGGLPVGLQILGFRDCDADLIAISRWISQSVPKSDF